MLRKPTVSVVSQGREATNHILTNSSCHGVVGSTQMRGEASGKGAELLFGGALLHRGPRRRNGVQEGYCEHGERAAHECPVE